MGQWVKKRGGRGGSLTGWGSFSLPRREKDVTGVNFSNPENLKDSTKHEEEKGGYGGRPVQAARAPARGMKKLTH